MQKKLLIFSVVAACTLFILQGVGECWYGGMAKIKIEEYTRQYITKFSMEHYSETVDGNEVYTKGRIIFNDNGVWHNFYAILNAESCELLHLEIDDRIFL